MSILTVARDHMEETLLLPPAKGFETSELWAGLETKTLKAIRGFTNEREAIDYAQTLGSGFNYNRPKVSTKDLIVYYNHLKTFYPDFDITKTDFHESQFSRAESTADLYGRRATFILLTWYLRAYLGAIRLGVPRKVLEVGGGYGAMAHLLRTAHPAMRYMDVDLPTSLFFAEVFLSLNFPGKVGYGPDAIYHPIRLVPIASLGRVKDKFDWGLNMGSFQEMPRPAVVNYLKFLRRHSWAMYSRNAPGTICDHMLKGMDFTMTRQDMMLYLDVNTDMKVTELKCENPYDEILARRKGKR